MSNSPSSAGGVVSFGPFQLLPARHLLLEGEVPVRLGSRALAILTTLVERPGELVTKGELMTRVWPDTFVDETALRVHVSALRRALGDGQTGRRFVANVPGRGYQFVAPVEISEPRTAPSHVDMAGSRPHNLPFAQTRPVGRAGTMRALADLLPKQWFITIVGAGGIGKTTVALALAEALLPTYEDGVRIVDLAPVDGPQFVPSDLGLVLGLSIHPENAAAQLVDFLRGKRMLIVLDSCERVIDAAASLAEQLVAGAAGVHILATSREPLRAKGEWVHRLQPLDVPADPSELTAAEALTYPAVQLFVERAAAILDGFELSDADAPIVSAICCKLGGIALAIELAAARVDAFGVQQLKLLLDDRFRILNRGSRTAQPRHQSLAAALDWSYEFLPEIERAVLCRLSVFAGAFALDSAIAVAGDNDIDVVEALADLVAKSLVSADAGGPVVLYRLLEITRVYALEKLRSAGDFDIYARRHAQHYLDWFKSAEANWQTLTHAEWLVEYGRRIDDLRAALNWGYSSNGDIAIAASLTAASIALLPTLAPGEALQYIERALGSRTAVSTLTAHEETRLLRVLAGALTLTKGPQPYVRKFLTEALEIAERMDDVNGRVQALLNLSVNYLWTGSYRESAALAERSCAAGGESSDVGHRLMGAGVAAHAFYCLGEFGDAQRHIDSILNEDSSSRQYWFFGFRNAAQTARANLQWLRGSPDRAMRSVETTVQQAEANGVPIIRMNTFAEAACPIALYVGDFAAAERWIATLLDLSTRGGVPLRSAHGRCLKGMLLLTRGDRAGLPLLESALDWLREANFAYFRAIPTAALAQGLAEAGEMTRARDIIDEALEQATRSEEHWCMPELLRIKGEILLSDGAQNATGEAEDYFRQALDRARHLEALSWELRAATSLAKLWRRDGKTAKAKELLSSVYDRFTEGFETADLKAARALTDALGAPPVGR
jgi:predicted ATPase/DNA-binding winged helix-turn-helix (wHTH) protein